MKAILFKNGIYVGVDTDIDKTLDDNKIRESEELIIHGSRAYCFFGIDATLWGGRVTLYSDSWRLNVDGINIGDYNNNDSCLELEQTVSYLNQMEQFGVDTFLANYKQALEKTKEELTTMCDKISSELSVQEDEEKSKLLNHLRNRITDIIFLLLPLMINVNVGLDNHDYVDAYNAIVNECSKE